MTKTKRKRGRPPTAKPAKDERLIDKILAAVQHGQGEPARYASTTKGSMKLLYDGHHFRFTFRRGLYSIFQCCYKENMQECKVRVVSDQKRIYPLDGEHIHFMQATDLSVTSMVFEPDDEINDLVDDGNGDGDDHATQEEDAVESEQERESDPFDEYEVQVTESAQLTAAEEEEPKEYITSTNIREHTEENSLVTDTNDFREKIKRRLQKALLGKKK